MVIKHTKVKSNGSFGLLEGLVEHKQHPNQQEGLDLYVKVVNFWTRRECFVKLYENSKGLYFKQEGTHYLNDFTEEVVYVPFQILDVEDN